MPRRQRVPRQWAILSKAAALPRRLPRGTGLIVLGMAAQADLRRLIRTGLPVVQEGRLGAVRVHNVRELRRALLARTPLILLSPIFPTGSHPDWKPIPRMRAATLARLGGRRLIALGGMNARKFSRIEALGFQAWAGISAFRT